MKDLAPGSPLKRLMVPFLLISALWTIMLALLVLGDFKSQQNNITKLTLSSARAFFHQVRMTRFWNAQHGGVYVPVTDETLPNPFLEVPHRDVETVDGKELTLINPAFMTRQLSEIAGDHGGIQFHITSRNPIRPANKPSEWEHVALDSFRNKGEEFYEWHNADSEEAVFRYMAPLWTEQPCLACHEKQGYKLGDQRGGISVSIPAATILSERNKVLVWDLSTYGLIWLVGLMDSDSLIR